MLSPNEEYEVMGDQCEVSSTLIGFIGFAYTCIPHFSNGTTLRPSQTLTAFNDYDALPRCGVLYIISESSTKCADQTVMNSEEASEENSSLPATDVIPSPTHASTKSVVMVHNTTLASISTDSSIASVPDDAITSPSLFVRPTINNVASSRITSTSLSIMSTSGSIYPTSSVTSTSIYIHPTLTHSSSIITDDIKTSPSPSVHPIVIDGSSINCDIHWYIIYILAPVTTILMCVVAAICTCIGTHSFYRYRIKNRSGRISVYSVRQSWPCYEPYQVNVNYVAATLSNGVPPHPNVASTISQTTTAINTYSNQYASLSVEHIDPPHEYQGLLSR